MMLRVVELFAGIGAQATALENLGIEHGCMTSEIDPAAIRMYGAIHGETENLGDITAIEHLPECDLVTWSFPCQDLSVAGKQRGMEQDSGTRSALGWEVIRLVRDAADRGKAPRFLLMENVPAVLFDKNRAEFDRMRQALSDAGYTNTFKVLNAKDFGVPQNRERCFMVSEYQGRDMFEFPDAVPLTIRLKDVLEQDVPESYYLSEERIATYQRHKERQEAAGYGFGLTPQDPERERESHAITTHPSKSAGNTVAICPKARARGSLARTR